MVEVESRVGVTRREFGWDRVLVETIWHGEVTSKETSLLLALVLGFSDSVAKRVSCILILCRKMHRKQHFRRLCNLIWGCFFALLWVKNQNFSVTFASKNR